MDVFFLGGAFCFLLPARGPEKPLMKKTAWKILADSPPQENPDQVETIS